MQLDILGRDDGIRIHIAEHGDFGFDVGGEHAVGPAQENVGLDTDAAQFLDTVLGRFCFNLPGRADVGHKVT
jgi:hypothetical protein